MNVRLLAYFSATLLSSLGAGISEQLTAAGWAQLIVFSLAAALTSAIAYYDKSANPPAPPRLPLIIAIGLALALPACTTAQRAQLRSDAKAIVGLAVDSGLQLTRDELKTAIQNAGK